MARRQLLLKRRPANTGGLYFSSTKTNIDFISSGCAVLDCVLGGGWPLGRIVNVVGDKSTGKTLLAMEAIANAFITYPSIEAHYIEAESAFDPEYARALGIPIDAVNMADCATVEEFCTYIEELKETDTPKLVILDCLDAITTRKELEQKIGAPSYHADKAAMLSEFFRRQTKHIRASNCCVMIVSQVRDAIGITFGERNRRSGGRALDFYASQVLWLSHTQTIMRTINKVSRPVSIRIKAKCKKNKIGLPFRECEFLILFGYGINDAAASIDFLKNVGVPVPAAAKDKAVLRAAVTAAWNEIEAAFIPTERKY